MTALESFPTVLSHFKKQHLHPIAREVEAKEVDLLESILSGGTVFGVPKSVLCGLAAPFQTPPSTETNTSYIADSLAGLGDRQNETLLHV